MDSAPADDDTTTESRPSDDSGRRDRDVVVPMRLDKTVTVFSTLIAIVGVVVGFVLLDAATIRLSLLRRLVLAALRGLGVTPSADVLSAVLAVFGLASIAFGAGIYVLGTRFRARGMGNPQEDADES